MGLYAIIPSEYKHKLSWIDKVTHTSSSSPSSGTSKVVYALKLVISILQRKLKRLVSSSYAPQDYRTVLDELEAHGYKDVILWLGCYYIAWQKQPDSPYPAGVYVCTGTHVCSILCTDDIYWVYCNLYINLILLICAYVYRRSSPLPPP